jgi:type VI secretion system lysozyme-like protein
MAQPKVIDAAPALLFERLVDTEPMRPRDVQPFRTLTPDALRASIARELARLLDTRRPVGIEAALNEAPEDLTVLDYGIPDPTVLTPQNILERADLAAVIGIAIRAFEPRLRDPAVAVDPDPARRNAVVITVSGTMRVGTRMQPVSFPLALDLKVTDVPR